MEAARAATILRFAAGEAWRPIGEVYAGVRAAPAALHGAPAARRRRPHHAVELPDRDPGVEARTRPHPRQHGRPQARLRGTAHRSPRRRVLRRGRPPGRRPQRADRAPARTSAPSWSPTPTSARSPSRGRFPSVTPSATRRRRAACRVQLELGGHNPLIVTADAELDRAVEATYAGAFWSAGQKCTATRRILVQEDVYESFRDALLARIAAGRVGDPSDPETEVGPLVNEGPMEDVLDRDRARQAPRAAASSSGGERDGEGYLVDAHGLRGRRRRRVPLVRGGLRPGHVALPLRDARRGDRARERRAVRALRLDLHRATSTRCSASRRSSRRASST